jgi:hypothetical protein
VRETERLSTSSVLNGTCGIGLSRASSSWRKTSAGTLPVTWWTRTIGEIVAPGGGLDIEIVEILKAAARPEALTQESDRALDTALFVSSADVASEGAEAARLRIFHKARIEDGVARRMLEHHHFHIVEDIDDGAAAVEAQAVVHAAQERRD